MATIIFVVADKTSLTSGESALKTLYETVYTVQLENQADAVPSLTGISAIILGPNTTSAGIHSSWKNPSLGMMFNDAPTAVGLGILGNNTADSSQAIDIVDDTHPLANGLTGTGNNIYTSSQSQDGTTAGTGTGSTLVARRGASGSRKVLVAWDAGDEYSDATVAAARRAFHGMGPTAATNLNSTGNSLILNAIVWIINASGTTYNQATAGALSFTGTLARVDNAKKAGTLTFGGTLVKSVLKELAGSLTFSGALVKQTIKSFSGDLSFTGDLDPVKVIPRSFSGDLTFSGDLVTQINKSLLATLSFNGALKRDTSKLVAGNLNLAGSLATLKTKPPVDVAGELSFSGDLDIVHNVFAPTEYTSGSSRGFVGGTISGRHRRKLV